MSQKQKWLKAYWRWFLKTIDQRDYKKALELADIIERIKQR